MSDSLLIDRYRQAVQEDGIAADPGQQKIIEHLQRLLDQLSNTGSIRNSRLLKRLFRPDEDLMKGIYIWGGVGRGKTFLMDLFFSSAPVDLKVRTHFHRFMQSVHHEMKELRDTTDPLEKIGRKFSKRCKLLCLDEFFVLDIGDAVILSGLLRSLLENGVVIVVTSNTSPDNLYLGGIQRDRFMAAIRLINSQMDVVQIDDGTDFRLQTLAGKKLYYDSLSPETDAEFKRLFTELSAGSPTHSNSLEVLKRTIQTVSHSDHLAWFEFSEICDGPRSKADYIEIASLYRTVMISDIPELNWELENQARRFIELVDEFYDRGVHLIISAQSSINSLYTGKRLVKEFERTTSRLHEMQTDRYLSREHCVSAAQMN